jgi:hypothetical protein
MEIICSGFSFGYFGWTTGFVFFGPPPPTVALDPPLDTICCMYHHLAVGVPIAVLGEGDASLAPVRLVLQLISYYIYLGFLAHGK